MVVVVVAAKLDTLYEYTGGDTCTLLLGLPQEGSLNCLGEKGRLIIMRRTKVVVTR